MALTPGSASVRQQTKAAPSISNRPGDSKLHSRHWRHPRHESMAYRATRGAVAVTNAVQMAFAEAYVNGLELPDSLMRSLFDTFMPIIFNISQRS